MHDDFFSLEDGENLSLPTLPEGYEWSGNLWGLKSEGWMALYRPLNLGLGFVRLRSTDTSVDTFDLEEDLFGFLLKEKFVNMCGSNTDNSELQILQAEARRGKFRFICILPTTKCAFQCSYCHQKPRGGSGSTLTSVELRRCLAKCGELCAETPPPIDILLYGGEPLTAFDLTKEAIDIVKSEDIFRKNVRVTLTTSGYGLNNARADFLAENDVFVIVSIDGLPEYNDAVRTGKTSAYRTAEKALGILQKHNCRIGLSITVGKHNADNIEESVEHLILKFRPRDIGLNAFLHWVDGKPNPYQIDGEKAFKAVIAGFKTARKYGVYAEQPFRRMKPFAYRKPLLKDCSAPGERLVIAPGGVMGFCDSCYPSGKDFYTPKEFPDYDSADYSKWAGLSAVEMKTCRECPAMTVCGGACRFDAYSSTGTLDGCDSERGKFERKFLRWMIEETFKQKHTDSEYYIPTIEDRENIWKNIEIKYENQPFTAGSYGI